MNKTMLGALYRIVEELLSTWYKEHFVATAK